MHTRVKTKQEIEYIRRSGEILKDINNFIIQSTKVGDSTKDLADRAYEKLKQYKDTKPVFLNYYGFPHVMCVSLNSQVIHGIPKADIIIKSGDLVSIDFGVNYMGMITDSARTFVVGKTNTNKQHLIEKTDQALLAGIEVVKNATSIGTISSEIEKVLTKSKLGIVREYVGHGVGHNLHESPDIPNYGVAGTGLNLQTGMTIAIEPMATLGNEAVYQENDGWTVSTVDGSLSAHFEDTVLVLDNSYEILTR